MVAEILLIYMAGAVVIGALIGYFFRVLLAQSRKTSAELRTKEIILSAREEAKKIVENSQKEAEQITLELKHELKEREEKIKRSEDRLIKKEEQFEHKNAEFELEIEELKKKAQNIRDLKARADSLIEERVKILEKTAGLSQIEAKEQLIKELETKFNEDLSVRIQKLQEYGEDALEKKAQSIIINSIQRLGNSVASDIMSTHVQIQSDEIKGKIIGKEGRNIKAFERITGVEVIVDDSPNTITISSFNPIRRHVARLTLEKLIADGRIQPARIEEFYEKAKEEINKSIKEEGEHAVYECGLYNLDPKLISIIGRLHFRTSYGQNVLQHSIEVAHLAGMIAEEIGANVQVAKAGGLLHDIGKALDHEVQGTHVEIGRRILQKFNISEDIIKAMQAHHGEYPYETLESVIVQVADAISGSRPGARKDSAEMYLQRLEELEHIANTIPGVEKSFALSAGREIRVFVMPEKVNDVQAVEIAREIASNIEKTLRYPGEIRVTVIRETRVIEFAR